MQQYLGGGLENLSWKVLNSFIFRRYSENIPPSISYLYGKMTCVSLLAGKIFILYLAHKSLISWLRKCFFQIVIWITYSQLDLVPMSRKAKTQSFFFIWQQYASVILNISKSINIKKDEKFKMSAYIIRYYTCHLEIMFYELHAR